MGRMADRAMPEKQHWEAWGLSRSTTWIPSAEKGQRVTWRAINKGSLAQGGRVWREARRGVENTSRVGRGSCSGGGQS